MRETETWKEYNEYKEEFGRMTICSLFLDKPKFTITEFIVAFKKWEYFYGIKVVSPLRPVKNLTEDVVCGRGCGGEGGHSFTTFRERPKRFLDALVRKDFLMKEKELHVGVRIAEQFFGNREDWDYDADGIDCLLQIAAMQEVIYG